MTSQDGGNVGLPNGPDGRSAACERARRRHRRHAKPKAGSAPACMVEALETRCMLAANVLDVAKVMWQGQMVDAVRTEYVLRMPQINVTTAKSIVDYQTRNPVPAPGWSIQNLGLGFFKLTAPGVTQATVTSWATRQGATSIDVNRVSKLLKTPNDPLYGDSSNWAFPKISAPLAWDTGTGTSSTIVAVLDSGVDYNHPDLAANMWRNPNEIAGDGVDNDKNGYVDDIHGINALTGSGNPMDDNGHGTFCAGLIGAVGNNAAGIAGVNWSVKIMAVKTYDAAGRSSVAAELRGITYVMSQKVAGQNVAASNHSYGGYGFDQEQFDALSQLAATGVTIVAAAGNDGTNNDVRPLYPASYNIPGLISVAASDQTDDLAVFQFGASNFGKASVDLAAPGLNVLSTRAAITAPGEYPVYNGNTGYSTSSGTSFAAPLVAGTAALLKSLKPGASTQQVKDAILNGVDKVPSLNGLVFTGGRLNVKNSVDLMLSTAGATPVANFKTGAAFTVVEGNQGYSYVDIKVTLDRPVNPGKSAAVWYETRPGGSAINDVDFVSQSGYLTFSNSEMEKSFRLKIIGDRLPEQEEQFAVRLDQAKSRGVTIGTLQTNVRILDDDNTSGPSLPTPTNPLVPRASIDFKRDAANQPLPIREGSPATFVVSLDKTSNKTITVKYRTNQPVLVTTGIALQGVDYTATSGTVTFRPGERTKEFSLPILADRLVEGNETFDILLFDPINAEVLSGNAAGNGGAITATITDVPYSPPAQSGFQITLNYLGDVPTGIRGAAEWAAARWSQVITGDLPNVTDPQTGVVIDDLMINLQVGLLGGAPTDGPGNALANARPLELRTTIVGQGLPWKAEAGIDLADANNPLLKQIVLHEFGHALGFGSFLFGQKNLVDATGTLFVGANALREYRSIFGRPTATGVPLETGGGAGTAGSHWEENTFQSELMTGFATGALPLSRLTIGAMQDLGYTVNYARADAYTKPVAIVAPRPTSVTAPLTGSRPVVLAPSRTALMRLTAAPSMVSQPIVSPSAARSFLSSFTAGRPVPAAHATVAGVSAGLPGRTVAFAALGEA